MAQHLTKAAVQTLIAHSFTAAAAKNITGVAAADNVVTVTTSAPHGYAVNDWVLIKGLGKAVSTPTVGAAKNVSGVAEAGGVVTVTTATPHLLAVGDLVLLEGIGGAVEANGPWIVATVADASNFSLTGLAAITPYTSGGTSKKISSTSGGAVEAEGLFTVAAVPLATTFTLTGLTAVSTYISGGAAHKVTITGLARNLKPYQLTSLADALNRVPHVENHDAASGSGESTLATIFA
jgi:hypothetical protein